MFTVVQFRCKTRLFCSELEETALQHCICFSVKLVSELIAVLLICVLVNGVLKASASQLILERETV